MGSLNPIVFITPGALGAAIEVTVASIASPTELNTRAAAQGDIILARTTEAGTGTQTWYYADTTSDVQSLPYIVTSGTAGVMFIAFAGAYSNTANVKDAGFAITGSADITKTIKFESDTQNAGFTFTYDVGAQTASRRLSVPALTADATLAVLSEAQTFSGAKTFSAVMTVSNATSASSSTVGAAVFGNGTAATSAAIGAGIVRVGTGIGVGAAPTANFPIVFLSNVNGPLSYYAQNASNGAGALTSFRAYNDVDAYMECGIAGTGFTYGAISAGSGFFNQNSAAGICIMAEGAAGSVRFASGGAAERVRVSAAGNLLVGTAADTGLTGAGGMSIASTTNATSVSAAAVVASGGIAVTKNIIGAMGRGTGVTSTATLAGTVTLTATSTEIHKYTGATAGTVIQFPLANLMGAGISVLFTVNNQSTQTVTPTRAGADTFSGGGTTDPVLAGASMDYASDGVSLWMKK